MAKQSKTILRRALQLAVMANALSANPVRDVSSIKAKSQPKGAEALTAEQLRNLLAGVRSSEYCVQHDLADPITLLIATGLRRSELLALRLPVFAVEMLKVRRGREFHGEQVMIFPATSGTWRDANNFAKQWRAVREILYAANNVNSS